MSYTEGIANADKGGGDLDFFWLTQCGSPMILTKCHLLCRLPPSFLYAICLYISATLTHSSLPQLGQTYYVAVAGNQEQYYQPLTFTKQFFYFKNLKFLFLMINLNVCTSKGGSQLFSQYVFPEALKIFKASKQENYE